MMVLQWFWRFWSPRAWVVRESRDTKTCGWESCGYGEHCPHCCWWSSYCSSVCSWYVLTRHEWHYSWNNLSLRQTRIEVVARACYLWFLCVDMHFHLIWWSKETKAISGLTEDGGRYKHLFESIHLLVWMQHCINLLVVNGLSCNEQNFSSLQLIHWHLSILQLKIRNLVLGRLSSWYIISG